MLTISKKSLLTVATVGMTILSGCQQDNPNINTPAAAQNKASDSTGAPKTEPATESPPQDVAINMASKYSITTWLEKREKLNKDLSNLDSFKSNLNKIVFTFEMTDEQLQNVQRIEVIPESIVSKTEYIDLSSNYEKNGFLYVRHETRIPQGSNTEVKYRVKTIYVDDSVNEVQHSTMPDLYIGGSVNGPVSSQTQGIMAGNNAFDTIVLDRATVLIGSQNIAIDSEILVSLNSSIETFEEHINDLPGTYGLSGGELTLYTQESLGTLKVTMRGLNGKPGADNYNPQAAMTTAGADGSPAKIRVVKYKDIDIRAIISEEVCTVKATSGQKGPKGLTGHQGGTGSKGGDTGSFLFLTPANAPSLQLSVNLEPGKGGIGGRGGPGGKGGPGGQPGRDHPACDSKAKVGPQGDDGDQGPNGVSGENGTIKTKKIQFI